ncbi:ABC transporter substrate-binding protein [Bradyrhizobium manausense]|uniref:ABC transporter substrate-binding protein n=1 Tax=Bradyrhizobium manausense TaxID=989370 RepID=UPI001BAB87F3|nr:ABC transporter substrate-binding protein [Bradyrhizobium manausense]MBR0724527.1 ABC transporter substrate-binding protein [Bradyrhizobium manausense]
MRRRELIVVLGVAVAWPFAACAQQSSGKLWRVAALYPGSWDTPSDQAPFDAFRDELQKLGLIEGKNIVIDRRAAYGHSERIASLAEELLALQPDVFVAISPAAAVAAHRATSTVPIVMWGVGEPMALGLVDTLAHPGGNVTGTSTMSDESCAKSVEILHAAFPAAKRIAVLMSSNPSHPRLFDLVKTTAGMLSVRVIPVKAETPNDLKHAFAEMQEKGCDALLVMIDVVRPAIPSLAAESRLPALYQQGAFAGSGALLCYGASQKQIGRRTAYFVDRLLKGARPADLPVEQPVVFELTVNLKTAAALGLRIPDVVLAQADQVIE